MHIQNIIQTKTNETGYVPDFGIHKGIVIDVVDPIKGGGRVQVYVPDLHGVNLFAFLNAKGVANVPTVGGNVGDLNKQALEYLKTFCPWADICSPILTDSGPGTSENNGEFNLVAKNDAKKFEGLTTPFGSPSNSLLPRGNPFAYVTVPAYSQSPAGVYGVPRVGAQVMILFYKGDLNAPVCIGSANGVKQFAQIFALDGSSQNSPNSVPLPSDQKATTSATNKPAAPVTTNAEEPLPVQGDSTSIPPAEPNPLLPSLNGSR